MRLNASWQPTRRHRKDVPPPTGPRTAPDLLQQHPTTADRPVDTAATGQKVGGSNPSERAAEVLVIPGRGLATCATPRRHSRQACIRRPSESDSATPNISVRLDTYSWMTRSARPASIGEHRQGRRPVHDVCADHDRGPQPSGTAEGSAEPEMHVGAAVRLRRQQERPGEHRVEAVSPKYEDMGRTDLRDFEVLVGSAVVVDTVTDTEVLPSAGRSSALRGDSGGANARSTAGGTSQLDASSIAPTTARRPQVSQRQPFFGRTPSQGPRATRHPDRSVHRSSVRVTQGPSRAGCRASVRRGNRLGVAMWRCRRTRRRPSASARLRAG